MEVWKVWKDLSYTCKDTKSRGYKYPIKPTQPYTLAQLPKLLLFQDKIEKRQCTSTRKKLPKFQLLRNYQLIIKNKISDLKLVPWTGKIVTGTSWNPAEFLIQFSFFLFWDWIIRLFSNILVLSYFLPMNINSY